MSFTNSSTYHQRTTCPSRNGAATPPRSPKDGREASVLVETTSSAAPANQYLRRSRPGKVLSYCNGNGANSPNGVAASPSGQGRSASCFQSMCAGRSAPKCGRLRVVAVRRVSQYQRDTGSCVAQGQSLPSGTPVAAFWDIRSCFRELFVNVGAKLLDLSGRRGQAEWVELGTRPERRYLKLL
jgi:hypothetical protein